jgi:hypothetical protein
MTTAILAGGQKSKETAHNKFNEVFKMEEFVGTGHEDNSSMLGSHSITWKVACNPCS